MRVLSYVLYAAAVGVLASGFMVPVASGWVRGALIIGAGCLLGGIVSGVIASRRSER